MINEEFAAQLRRLGMAKGVRHLKEARPGRRPAIPATSLPTPDSSAILDTLTEPEEPQQLEVLLPAGRLESTPAGECFVLDHVYPLAYRHGRDRLADLLEHSPAGAARFCADPRLSELDFRDFLFLDVETTGLGGPGTLAFMVGVAFFEGDAVVVRQFFLRDHDDEPALLHLLDDLLATRAGLVTFNGRSFDIPLLDTRYLMNYSTTDLRDRPHLDLLPPARRLWRPRLGSCALASLEKGLLGVRRTEEDVPGWLIPRLYNDYLRSGNASMMLYVFYHNHLDMLSMVTLAARVMCLLSGRGDDCHPLDLWGLGKWQAELGLVEEAEQTLRQAAAVDLPTEDYHRVLHQLGHLLKRQGRREEAVLVWQQIASTTFEDVSAHVELAKHYEWHGNDLFAAITWTTQAIALVERWPAGNGA